MNLTCKICNETFTPAAFGMHIKHKHNMNCETYYKTYIDDTAHVCKTCGKATRFISIIKGYAEHCNAKCARNDPDIIKKREATCMQKYGVKCSFAAKSAIEKRLKTCKEKYGDECPQKTQAVKDKQKQTCLAKWNTESYTQTDDFKQKVKNTCLAKSNGKYEWTGQFPDTISQRIKRFKEKHDSWLSHYQETCIEKYGVSNPMQVSEIRKRTQNKYIYDMRSFDSAAEIAYYIWLKDKGVKFIYQPHTEIKFEYGGKTHYYEPDFLVNNEYVEIKGSHFFDENGKMINPFDRSQDELYEAKHQCMIKHNVKIVTDYSEYENYVTTKYGDGYIKMFTIGFIDQIYETLGDFPYPSNMASKNDIITAFHKSIWEAKSGNHLSPLEAWQDPRIMKRLISNRLMYDALPITANKVRNAMSVTKLAPKVSVFSYACAKHLVEKYLAEYDIVFDPFSGFSGRMLGVCDCGKTYIGQDINSKHVAESNELIAHLHLQATVTKKDIFVSTGEYDCLFTCSPYRLKETWNEHETNLSCDAWIDECLQRFRCKRYIFVVDETKKYKNSIVETIYNRSHYNENSEFVLCIQPNSH